MIAKRLVKGHDDGTGNSDAIYSDSLGLGFYFVDETDDFQGPFDTIREADRQRILHWTSLRVAADVLDEPSPPEKIIHPRHYNTGKIEVWDFIADQQLGFFSGNAIKYICRGPHKENHLEDLKKAHNYLGKLIELGGIE